MDYPATTRPCNRYPCPSSLAGWAVGPWGSCTVTAVDSPLAPSPAQPCAGGMGTQTRAVVCRSVGVGREEQVEDAVCLALSPNTTKPTTAAPCTVQPMPPACVCHSNGDCPGAHWICNTTAQLCVCSAQWGGSGCSVPLVSLALTDGGSPCLDGVVDIEGHCCQSFIDAISGRCCKGDGSVDGSGRCCDAGTVDACGVCGGSGVAVDALGHCCGTALPPSGICCEHAVVDNCGICGGLNMCTYVERGGAG